MLSFSLVPSPPSLPIVLNYFTQFHSLQNATFVIGKCPFKNNSKLLAYQKKFQDYKRNLG